MLFFHWNGMSPENSLTCFNLRQEKDTSYDGCQVSSKLTQDSLVQVWPFACAEHILPLRESHHVGIILRVQVVLKQISSLHVYVGRWGCEECRGNESRSQSMMRTFQSQERACLSPGPPEFSLLTYGHVQKPSFAHFWAGSMETLSTRAYFTSIAVLFCFFQLDTNINISRKRTS